jgi:cadmium resistance protein CadD (predicted permease)
VFEGILTAALSFVATNLDDIVILMLLFSLAKAPGDYIAVTAGQFLGVGILTCAGLLGAVGLGLLPVAYLRWLGLVPLFLGIRGWIQRKEADSVEALPGAGKGQVLSVALLTVANGGDNLGVWIPLFAGYSSAQRLMAAVVFAAMTGVWCFLGRNLSKLPGVNGFLQRNSRTLVPWVLMLLGLYILLA